MSKENICCSSCKAVYNSDLGRWEYCTVNPLKKFDGEHCSVCGTKLAGGKERKQ